MRERISPVGESVTTTAITSPSRITGEATTIRPSCQGQTWPGSWLRRDISEVVNASRVSPVSGISQFSGARAMGSPLR